MNAMTRMKGFRAVPRPEDDDHAEKERGTATA